MSSISFSVNRRPTDVDVRASTPLLYVLRNDLGLVGTRFGCGDGDCGSCMVWLDGRPTLSCQLPVISAEGCEVTTIEGLANEAGLHPLQTAILELNAGQCAYCLSGMIMTAAALLRDETKPSRARIAEALDEHLCRCGTHRRIIEAVERAALAAPQGL